MIGQMSLMQIAAALDGQLIDSDAMFMSVSIDTRTLSPGDLYVAIKGDQFDGHQFVDEAKQAGAVAAIVSEDSAVDLPQLRVKDTRIALGQLGALNRDRFQGKVLAITGSAGKTTVKEMAAAILAVNHNVHATAGNYNNDIGVPLTLLAMNVHHEASVCELGASAVGEIAYTTALTKPDVAILTNAGEAHVEGFGSLENIVLGKGEIIAGLPANGVAVINADDRNAAAWIKRAGARKVITFGVDSSSGADVYAADCVENSVGRFSFLLTAPSGTVPVSLPHLGIHNVRNAMSAAAATLAMGCTLDAVKAGLETTKSIAGRLVIKDGINNSRVFDDTYNASPSSLKAALDVLAKQQGERWLVLGDMAELGESSQAMHDEVVRYALQQGIGKVWGVGQYTAAAIKANADADLAFDGHQSLIQQLTAALQKNTYVLVKGSRSAHMEDVVAAITEESQDAL